MPRRRDELTELLVHELRGPLTVIAGYAEVLERPLPAAERRRALQGIARAVARANLLLEDVLARRLPDGATMRRAEVVSLAELARFAAEEEHAKSGREVVVQAPAAGFVLGDRSRLEAVIANLVDNAAKYSPSPKPITLRVSQKGDRVLLEVFDRGPGVPEAECERLLKPFERLARDAEQPGAGLGLHVVRAVVEAHGGSVAIGAGMRGRGTRVVVDLPAAPEPEPSG